MNAMHKDMLIAALFITGLMGFISGDFVLSATLFASASIASNTNVFRKMKNHHRLNF